MFVRRSLSTVSRRGISSLARGNRVVFKGKNVLREGLSTSVPSTFSLTRHQPLAFSFTSFNRTYATAPESESEAQESSAPETEAAPQGREWSTVESALHPGLYKALTSAPFSFKHMSPVQEAVISLLERGIANPSVGGPVDSAPSTSTSSLDLYADEPSVKATGGLVKPPTPDLLVKSKTGTGKTVAFLIPAIESRIKSLSLQAEAYRAAHPGASQKEVDVHVRKFASESTGTLILSPTRELATQIANEAIKLCSHLPGFQVQLLVGGTNKRLQLNQWSRGRRDIVVATPGRMNDLLITEPMVESSVAVAERLILDEADTLLDMGFKDEIKRIMLKMPPKQKRQTFMFSATLENDVKEVARAALNPKPLFINTVLSNENNTHAHVPQYATVVDSPSDVIPHIMRLIAQDQLENPKGGKAIIFLPTTKYTETFAQIAAALRRDLPFSRSTHVYEIHSRKSQENRIRVARMFKESAEGTYKVLVTSDVSARGVDYPNVTRVIQVGIPSTPETYVHRVGRTGRAGKGGRGDLVLLPWEKGYLSWCLKDVNLRTLSVADLEKEISDLCEKFEASAPAARVGRSRFSDEQPRGILPQVASRLAKLPGNLRNSVLPIVPNEDAREVFQSLIGYYASRSSDLRTDRESILEGCRAWAVGALGLEQAPELSHAFLQKLGMSGSGGGRSSNGYSSRSNSGFGRGGNFGGQRSGYGSRDGQQRGGYGNRGKGGYAQGGFGGRTGFGQQGGYGRRDGHGQTLFE